MAKGSETGGCLNCYAARMASRGLPTMKSPTTGEDFAIMRDTGPRWTGKVELIESALERPLGWKKPQRIFVNSMSDLFHESLSNEAIDRVFAVMALCPQHTFQVLTKRPERMRYYCQGHGDLWGRVLCHANILRAQFPRLRLGDIPVGNLAVHPLRNCWLGVSVENQATADARIPLLLQTPAAKRFISAEPLLGPVDFKQYISAVGLDLIIVGGESGPGARPMHPDWVRSIRDQCVAAGVSCFFKQWGEWAPCGFTNGLDSVSSFHRFSDGQQVERVGKRKSGSLLDGREWKQLPEVRA